MRGEIKGQTMQHQPRCGRCAYQFLDTRLNPETGKSERYMRACGALASYMTNEDEPLCLLHGSILSGDIETDPEPKLVARVTCDGEKTKLVTLMDDGTPSPVELLVESFTLSHERGSSPLLEVRLPEGASWIQADARVDGIVRSEREQCAQFLRDMREHVRMVDDPDNQQVLLVVGNEVIEDFPEDPPVEDILTALLGAMAARIEDRGLKASLALVTNPQGVDAEAPVRGEL
jgi:hypothetical protein